MFRHEEGNENNPHSVGSGSPGEHLEKLLTPAEAAEILGVNLDYIVNHCTRLKPYIPHVKLGGGRYGMRRFKPSQLAQFIEQQTTVPRRGSM